MIDLLTEFPALPRTVLRDFKRGIDTGFKEFSRSYGEAIETFFYPLLKFLVLPKFLGFFPCSKISS